MNVKLFLQIFLLLNISAFSEWSVAQNIVSSLGESPNTSLEHPFEFSVDQGAHRKVLTEWWYFTGHLEGEDGRKLGYELSFFKSSPYAYFVHVAITDEANEKFRTKRKYLNPFLARTKQKSIDIKYGKSGAKQTADFSYDIWSEFLDAKFNLSMSSTRDPMIINGNGIIDMPEGGTSFYYSLTRLETEGMMTLGDETFKVTGNSWMDHQWGNFMAFRIGWDWFSIKMDDGTDYNLYSFRNNRDESLNQYVNILFDDGSSKHSQEVDIKRHSWWRSSNTWNLYATQWELYIPESDETFLIKASMEQQEVARKGVPDLAPTYWEGSCYVKRISADGSVTHGLGYTEQFPYRSRIP